MITTDKEELLIGLTGDTHIPSEVSEILNNIIDDFKEKEIDYLIHLGDFTDVKIYNYLQETFGENKVIGIKGNMDNREIKDALPDKIDLNLFGHKILITHGSGGPKNIIQTLNNMFDLTDYDIIVFGHIHRPYNERWKDGKLYLSPGTPTDRRFTNINSYGFLKISKEKIEPEIVYL
ncbi:MAG: metallophosphoesterase family protein [Promethearchaeota archaeon]|jgi:putative phosphoesterase